jgi:xanthine dehydrogenase accessory factor
MRPASDCAICRLRLTNCYKIKNRNLRLKNIVNKELLDIIKYLEQAESSKTILATVVDVNGSSYRLPGARMLITEENGQTVGTVSGGCLEADVVERAKRILKTGNAETVTYDTRANDDSVFSLNMGCKGVIRILLERPRREFTDFLKHRLRMRQPGVIATLISVDKENENNENRIGARLLFDESGVIFSDFTQGAVFQLLPDCLAVLKERKPKVQSTSIGEVFLECVGAPTRLMVFGAGADAVSLVKLAKSIGWRVTVVDHRPAFATRERFPSADEVILSRPENLGETLRMDENTAAVLMTHNYGHDREILKFLLGSKAFYIGALGPKRRAESILSELRDESDGCDCLSPENLNRLHAPIGLDIGGDTPELISISIIAEVQSVIKKRTGGFLRNRKGSINERNATVTFAMAA